MKFHVGPTTYTVQRKYGLALDGEPVEGLIDYDLMVIYVDGIIENRVTVENILRHEHSHAWEWHVGKPSDSEQTAQWVATVGQTFDRDYIQSGGYQAFIALPVAGTRPSKELKRVPALSAAFMHQRCCGMCGQSIAAGSIASSDPAPLGGDNYVVDRWMVCPVCNTVTCWQESSDEHGTPTGGITKAKVLSGQDAAAWLKINPAPPCEWNVA